ncbi:GNAT family N-acetyltransferase [Lacticaseibacillus mingshuiensis]|uniref:GNAT family N-acetyltransferase n=1 Tax=Lacticaseibacillus mingshuiensis TaxID=2799574 RepID=A0ABW4CHS3_9LACO|nr:GNAT family N-acetyltransferase [Lacticaseibacillus mingshuiensis]
MTKDAQNIIYQTPRLYTRRLVGTDLTALARTLQDPLAMTAYAHAFSDAEVAAWLANQQARYREPGLGLLAVCRQSDDRLIGQCGLTHQDFGGQQVLEIGYLFERDAWHQGYAIEAARGAKAYAWGLGVTECWSIIRDTNFASMNVAIRNGMLVRGRIVKHYYGLDMPHLGFSVRRRG